MARLLDYIKLTASASSEEDVDFLLKLMNPTDDREEMGRYYDETLGYNPINYFDKKTLEKLLNTVKIHAPEDVALILEEQSEQVLERALSEYEDSNIEYLQESLYNIIAETTDWDPREDGSFDDDDDYEQFSVDEDECLDSDEPEFEDGDDE